jgi:hypothetical protein
MRQVPSVRFEPTDDVSRRHGRTVTTNRLYVEAVGLSGIGATSPLKTVE